ncbi:MAG: deoxyuridine 5'-triphosphate nucleotidohydrolase [Acidobacteria bacterium]|jgi:dUTP pyrophosphatase|nr:deoxyuridine 5'-triphosphate nucleotidohydrolase [Acidobacteriota bacterium]
MTWHTIEVRLERLPHAADLPLPDYATAGSSGVDLRAAVDELLWLAPGARAVVPTGFRVAIPHGWEGQVRARSGLALRHGLALPNAPGTIDSDYRGEVGVLLANLGDRPVAIHRGDRVAQLVLVPVARATFVEADRLDETPRGPGGFGSTGRR